MYSALTSARYQANEMADNFVGISNYAFRDLFATITRADLKAQPRDQGLTQGNAAPSAPQNLLQVPENQNVTQAEAGLLPRRPCRVCLSFSF